jgi:hypothetical protein
VWRRILCTQRHGDPQKSNEGKQPEHAGMMVSASHGVNAYLQT